MYSRERDLGLGQCSPKIESLDTPSLMPKVLKDFNPSNFTISSTICGCRYPLMTILSRQLIPLRLGNGASCGHWSIFSIVSFLAISKLPDIVINLLQDLNVRDFSVVTHVRSNSIRFSIDSRWRDSRLGLCSPEIESFDTPPSLPERCKDFNPSNSIPFMLWKF
ncbi:hypothetical protein SUGI_0676630 [Cryptomeria japonica]|nr:hypothetical protein SUGI_0676630 [Cryptomeria japonica]